ncbi:hypothetical protein TNCV_4416971 [Trichonephila clavipes]|uniref:Uncharacterized protein n=1 Tax=Trichonephila clavipes TaxID=2585209 RepID=A0A8X6VEM6_TRICX|nr:hypothetical protein TNCV_4416971 [Trichonephila clavipes]
MIPIFAVLRWRKVQVLINVRGSAHGRLPGVAVPATPLLVSPHCAVGLHPAICLDPNSSGSLRQKAITTEKIYATVPRMYVSVPYGGSAIRPAT